MQDFPSPLEILGFDTKDAFWGFIILGHGYYFVAILVAGAKAKTFGWNREKVCLVRRPK